MLGIHVNLTSPSRGKNKNSNKYSQEDYDILTTILSALKWRQNCGKIKMYTDSDGYEFYKKNNMIDLWDGGIDCLFGNDVFKNINPDAFWAAGKIYAIKEQKNPFCVIDTDMIVWSNLDNLLCGKDVVCVHEEYIGHYCNVDDIVVSEDYVIDKNYDFSLNPSNTALLYFENLKLKDDYVDKSIEFMKNSSPEKHLEHHYMKDQYILFAEQRMLAMISKKNGTPVKYLFDGYFPPDEQTILTHVWVFKLTMKKDNYLREEFCKKCIRRIVSEFPEYKDVLLKINELSKYYDYISLFGGNNK
jgi:hypothetical protein